MQGVPGPAPRPQPGREYGTPMICRAFKSTFLPSSLDIHHVFPRSREMKSDRPPTSSVLGLWGESRIGVFQLNCSGALRFGLITLLRPAGASAAGPSAPGSAAAPPPPPPPRPPP